MSHFSMDSGESSAGDTLTRIEQADSPTAAIHAARCLLYRALMRPLEAGHNVVKMVFGDDPGRAARAAVDTKF